MGSLPVSAPSRLFEPLKVGNMTLQHRLVMAPLTRFRADESHVILPAATTYYSQRSCVPGTLLITEATFISQRAGGYPNVPGIYTAEQVAAWKRVTDAVHAKGCYVYLQLWALGRTANPAYAASQGIEVVSSSPTPVGPDSPVPREIRRDEIQGWVDDYATAARNAVEGAGFDGVEIHAANGYLIDQFTQDVCNVRTDEYGGSVERRSRFGLEVARAVVAAVGAHRTGIRLSPFSTFQGMKMRDPLPQFTHFMRGLKELNLAYMHLVESRISGNADVEATEKIDPLIDVWDNTSPVLIAGGFRPASARRAVDEEYKDRDIAIVFGRYYISTPDLAFRIANNIDLSPYNRDTFYTPKSEVGYIDYPFSKEFEQADTKL
ncbi:uncharacterized protein PV07_05762 [Cladophialophora immunda]|uniref:NADH:flavin oxidoreductase/NADH oxidase N-terminal domain-containing protein n=1 Tax=Cladophialophora immunda TaxID=569365 RepID=A0A0D2D2N3_9EURO|nr:uncharacterized protein PV07_05762 [Cladophialophora immunda]KIW29979.1 hypothetical protein PV07_05762 [Cladophialophora immunda]OQV08128.1 hypothetical protein CLAIMM_12446 isoform 1 [Cladophialophora immunda]OQV08129.1 hypothetical protein CLAIMM_12446 isoform 2 [Cladophialophora immunda]OQV08130.1 hypothetical protein CLAIMM_12446 isoform 3 [Cladophialophora immunda]